MQEDFRQDFRRIANPPEGFLLHVQVIKPYFSPTPAAGVQRYVFSLFQQPGGAAIDVSPRLLSRVLRCF